jgi:hypothetical protein
LCESVRGGCTAAPWLFGSTIGRCAAADGQAVARIVDVRLFSKKSSNLQSMTHRRLRRSRDAAMRNLP